MACIIVPAAEAVVTTIATKIIEKREEATGVSVDKERFSVHLKRLNGLLWGGSALLAFEHIWHGEIQPFFPFLTAAETVEGTAEMLREMSTVGVSMALLVTAVWGVMTAASYLVNKKTSSKVVTEVKE